jgi:hypothetical protein
MSNQPTTAQQPAESPAAEPKAGEPQTLASCPRCGCDEMFVRKAFPQRLGLAIVIVAALAFVVLAAWRSLFYVAVRVLVIAVAIDAALYAFVPAITVCYRCRSEFRGPLNPRHAGFDLGIAEKYRRA